LGEHRDYLKVDIDLDRVDGWTAIYNCLKTLAYPSSYFHLTNKGVHICIPELPDCYVLRLMFSDDPVRVDMDEERKRYGLPTNVCFLTKNRRKVEVTRNIDLVLWWIEDLKASLKKRGRTGGHERGA
jgi:hypothetical protein